MALLFLPLLFVVPRGIAALATVAMVIGGGLMLSQSRRRSTDASGIPAALFGMLTVWGLLSHCGRTSEARAAGSGQRHRLVVAAVAMASSSLVSPRGG